ncbi:MAG: hypothetical protein H7061_00475 [Bdellovibrionaceae bacterium]|nr:hypothetical protein [Bdellovibrio sp.]
MKWTTLKISLLFIISLSQLIVLAGYLSYKNLNSILGSWNNSAHLSLYLDTDILDAERSAIEIKIKSNANVEKLDFIDRKTAAQDFQKSFGAYSAGLLSEDELIDLVPETLVVSLKNELSLTDKMSVFNEIIASTRTLKGIEEVSFGGAWLKKLSKLDRTLKSIGLFILAIMLLSVSFLSALMVRILIDDAKAELEVYNLIGATRWFLYQMFLKQIIIFTTVSLALSFVIVYGLYNYFKHIYLVKSMSAYLAERLIFLSVQEMAIFAGLVFVFIFTSSFIALKTTIQRLNQFSYE